MAPGTPGWVFSGGDLALRTDVTIEVVEAEASRRVVEHNVSAVGRAPGLRHHLRHRPAARRREPRLIHVRLGARPPAGRRAAPVVRTTMRRASRTVMRRPAAESARHLSAAGS
ncbi:hypothetical protein ACQPXS_12805 [Streptomyces sp. CA-142005]|uniref:hypothetical protein n=1 Tax=Streptomyces sp. CA-142005 TaxID=3240052 RepID=UPI003D947396